ncbi:S1 family peptidase [Actinacidiphila paucisporea]|uniref:Trypsin-like peptidase domain-containing protein n=1 Tax=Actinacidiphila paucisporea TaxID=310782 RepID=A0A1M6XGC1_9ACTN|nr:serine protease [Actinacidiphila paucisporea]SHL04953.1 Trypsin-like peptidase domain-containing protein [Actinacidiphila paucisporea]
MASGVKWHVMEADGGIGTGPLATPPWAVRIRRANGTIAGSGILLSPDRVLTCAHVVGRDEEVTAEFVGAHGPLVPEVAARVAGEAYRPEVRDANGDPVGDVALLALDRPRPAAEATSLHRVSAPGRAVRMYGFPAAYNGGLWLPATILGGCGRDGQVQLEPSSPAGVARRGFSGGGVVDLATDKVIGMVLASSPEEGGGFSFMSPAETIVQHLREVRRWVKGRTAVDEELRSAAAGDDQSLLDRPFAERLARWLRGGPAARQVKISLVPDDDPVRTATLRRAITLADRELRSRFSTGPPSLDSPGTVPAAGGLDLAVYATGRGTEEIAERIAERMDLLQHRELPAAQRIAAAAVTITLVVDGVDAAADPASLIGLLALLTSRGNRVLLVFRSAGDHLEHARRELLLRPALERRARLAGRLERIALGPGRELDGLMARVRGAGDLTDKAVDVLISVMAARAELDAGQGAFAGPPEDGPDLARYERMAARAERRLPPAIAVLRELLDRREELRGELGPYRRLYEESAARGEDLAADELYLAAYRSLRERPCDVAEAQAAVRRFRDLVDRPEQPAPGPLDGQDRDEGGTPT